MYCGSRVLGPSNSMLDCGWRRQTAVNLDGVFLSVKYAVPEMRRSGSGSTITMSSVPASGDRPVRRATAPRREACVCSQRRLRWSAPRRTFFRGCASIGRWSCSNVRAARTESGQAARRLVPHRADRKNRLAAGIGRQGNQQAPRATRVHSRFISPALERTAVDPAMHAKSL